MPMSFHNPTMPLVGAGAGALRAEPAAAPAGRRGRSARSGTCTWWTRSPSTATAATPRPGPASAASVPAAGADPRRRRGALRRAALPHQLQLPRRGQPPGGAGRGGGPAGADRAGGHRPRRLLRGGPLRRGGPGSWACRPSSAPSCPSDLPGPQNGEPDPDGAHLLVLARGPEGYARLCHAPSPRPSCAAGRRAARSTTWRSSPPTLRGPRAGAHRLPQGARCRRALLTEGVGRGGPRAGPADRAVRRGDTSPWS